MKHTLIFALLIVAGCSVHVPPVTDTAVNGYDYHIDIIDRCEYIIAGSGQSQMMSHKGNCKHCKSNNQNR